MSQHIRIQAGLEIIEAMFEAAQAQKRAAFLPYYPVGYPDYESSLNAITTMAEEGADGFEIGIPFSDPLADGPTIQAATHVALRNGTTVRACLQAVRDLRERGISQPMLLMGYINPLLAYGADRFVRDAKAAGADGLIIPDLPPEESGLFGAGCAEEALALVSFLAPTSSDARIRLVGEYATGFIYVVSLTGVTGVRSELPGELAQFIARVRKQTNQRLVVGFGISTRDHARLMSSLADGFIVGSAVVKAAAEGVEAVGEVARLFIGQPC